MLAQTQTHTQDWKEMVDGFLAEWASNYAEAIAVENGISDPHVIALIREAYTAGRDGVKVEAPALPALPDDTLADYAEYQMNGYVNS